MGREARRAQARAERRQRRQQGRGGSNAPRNPVQGAAAPAPAEQARGRGSLLRPAWITDIVSELRKVTWPTRKETSQATVVVIITVIIAAIFLQIFDALWSRVTGYILG